MSTRTGKLVYINERDMTPTSHPMALKRELSQSSTGAAPPRKTPRLTLTIDIPSSPPDPISTASTVSASIDERVPSPSQSSRLFSIPSLSVDSLRKMDPAQLVAWLEDLAEEYQRSVDEMGAEIDHLRREVSFARRRLEATPSLEVCDVAAQRASGLVVEGTAVSGEVVVARSSPPS